MPSSQPTSTPTPKPTKKPITPKPTKKPICMAGKTGLTKVEKTDGSENIVKVQNLEVGDRVKGIDDNMADDDDCEVVSVTRTGFKTVYGNYTVSERLQNLFS